MFCGHKKWSHRSIPRSKCVANFYSWLSCSEIRQRLFGAIWIFKKSIHSLLLVRLQMQKIISFFFFCWFFFCWLMVSVTWKGRVAEYRQSADFVKKKIILNLCALWLGPWMQTWNTAFLWYSLKLSIPVLKQQFIIIPYSQNKHRVSTELFCQMFRWGMHCRKYCLQSVLALWLFWTGCFGTISLLFWTGCA